MRKNNLLKGKKGVAEQSFNIITAVVIMGIILLFGGFSVGKLIINSKNVQDAQFRVELENALDEISSKYGAVKYITLKNLRSFDQMCVFDLKQKMSIPSNSNILSKYPLIKGAIEDETENVFLISSKGIELRFKNDKITLSENTPYLCENISSTGTLEVKLEGFGRESRFSFVEP